MKRCQVCGVEFDADEPDAWHCDVAFRGRHIPTDKPGLVYVLHFDQPIFVQEADRGHAQPTTHYVGWTSQRVEARMRQHGVPSHSLVESRPGTAEDEAQLKRTGQCPRCGVPLANECLGAGGGPNREIN